MATKKSTVSKATPTKITRSKKAPAEVFEEGAALSVTASEQIEAPAEANANMPVKATKDGKPMSPRYEAACAEVSRINRLFHESLSAKAKLLGTEKKNESVGVYSHPSTSELNEKIRETRGHLESLLEQKRQLKPAPEGLAEIDKKISELRKMRSLARQEKKVALAELS
ncbi:MAG TPA: hypothetical protein VF681_04835 [Abditibacteriaceae bacterium]|jgi:hypothetical protein